jgi:ABC-type Na+ efflux pump permease subunit
VTHVAGNRVAVIWAIARADFLERVRRYSFLFTLGFALYLGYLTISGNLVLQVGRVRGIFNSAWVGALLSLVASAFISLAGFYFVKNTIQRDRETRVGQILAATPLSKFIYVLGKVISNLTVLTLMIAVLALSGIAMQLMRGEDRHVEVWNLVAPFIFLALPAMVVVAAIAVLFETIPFLRGGFGNVAYFFVWTALLSVPLAVGRHSSDLIGISLVADSAREAAHLLAENGGVSFSLSFGQIAAPVSTFRWDGLNWTADIMIGRLAWLTMAFGVVTVSAFL